MEEVDIFIPIYNHLELTIKCVNALYENTSVPFRLTIIDDSTDLTPEYFKSLNKPNLQYIRQEQWVDHAFKKCNIALQNTGNEFVVLMSNSNFVEPDWIDAGLSLMKKNDDVGVVGFKMLYPQGTIWHAGVEFANGIPYHIGVNEPGHRHTYIKEFRAVSAGLFRRKALPDKFDTETYIGWVGFDDIDLVLSIKQRGWRILYCGLGCSYHIESLTRLHSLDKAKRVKFWQNYAENKTQFLNKWQVYLAR